MAFVAKWNELPQPKVSVLFHTVQSVIVLLCNDVVTVLLLLQQKYVAKKRCKTCTQKYTRFRYVPRRYDFCSFFKYYLLPLFCEKKCQTSLTTTMAGHGKVVQVK